MFKCTNCSWEGEELSKQITGAMHDNKCPVCGDEVIEVKNNTHKSILTKKEVKYDFNDDGVFDEHDVRLAAKAMAKQSKKKRSSRKTKKK